MHALLVEQKSQEAEKAKEKEQEEAAKKGKMRDPTIRILTSDPKKNKLIEGADDMQKLDEALQLGELTNNKDKDDVENLLNKGVFVRYADEKGEMPLHKLARVKKNDPQDLLDFKKVFNLLIEKMRAECAKEKRPLSSDINHQDKAGKTPLYVAIEHKNLKMVDLLYLLQKDGVSANSHPPARTAAPCQNSSLTYGIFLLWQPDSLLVNSVGWTVLHAAVNANDLEVIKKLITHFTAARKKILLATRDKTGRTPLHIASFKDESMGAQIVE